MFPSLKELYYKDGAGFIEYRLKTVRQSAKRSVPSSQLAAVGAGDKAKKTKRNDNVDHTEITASVEVLEQVSFAEEMCRNYAIILPQSNQ